MMAFDFPSNPTPDQVVTFADGSTYKWNGISWERMPDQPPPPPTP